jgi:tetratricopeptide (TPR) repeat protein
MAAASKCKIQRALEEKGELSIEITKRTHLDVRIEQLGDDSSRIHIEQKMQSDLPSLFWHKEMQQLLSSYISAGSLLSARLEKYITSHETIYARRELLPAEYHTLINYGLPRRNVSNKVVVLLTLALYPLIMFCYGHSLSLTATKARYLRPVNPVASLALFDKALGMQPDSLRLLFERGELLLQLNRPQDAESDFRTALNHQPYNRFIIYGLQSALIQQGKLDEMTQLDNDITELGIETPDVLNNRAWDEAITGNPELCIFDSNRAIAMDPSFHAAYGTRGYGNHLLGDEQAAIADYTTAIHLNPQDRVDYFLRAQSLRNLGEFDAAATDEAKAKELGFYWSELAVPPSFDSHGDPPRFDSE